MSHGYKTLVLVMFFLSIFSCSTPPKITNAESDAQVVYLEGMHYLDKKDFEMSEKKFMKVISDFSYSKYEPFATVALGDTYFKKEDYSAAVEVYRRFVKMRPKHEKTPWATLQIANSYFEQRPSDFFIFPHPAERDVEIVEKAVAAYNLYLKKYPEDENKKTCLEQLNKAELILIEKDLRIAEFYAKKDRCPGVHMRIKHINDNFKITTEKNRKRIADLITDCPISSKDSEKKKKPKKEETEKFDELSGQVKGES